MSAGIDKAIEWTKGPTGGRTGIFTVETVILIVEGITGGGGIRTDIRVEGIIGTDMSIDGITTNIETTCIPGITIGIEDICTPDGTINITRICFHTGQPIDITDKVETGKLFYGRIVYGPK